MQRFSIGCGRGLASLFRSWVGFLPGGIVGSYSKGFTTISEELVGMRASSGLRKMGLGLRFRMGARGGCLGFGLGFAVGQIGGGFWGVASCLNKPNLSYSSMITAAPPAVLIESLTLTTLGSSRSEQLGFEHKPESMSQL